MENQTKVIRTQIQRGAEKEHSSPIHMTSSFVFDNAEQMQATFAGETAQNVYSRFINPNSSEFIEKMCVLEEAEAGHATASGMAAVFASFMALLQSGDHILSSRSIFGSTHGLFTKWLPKYGITSSYVDFDKLDSWEKSIQENTKALYLESPTNPGLDIIDVEKAADIAKRHNLILIVDNCFATPIIQKPLTLGADLVVHSATKFIDGQGRAVGGIVLGKKELIDEIYQFCRATGPAISPFNSWLFSKSLETLEIRMEKHSDNALKLAEFLESSEEVFNVKYPFLKSHTQYDIARKQMLLGGGLVAFELVGDSNRGAKFLNALNICSLTANLGDTRTIVSHPASTTHSKLEESERLEVGITPGLIRVSVGLENINSIIEDISLALQQSKS